MKYLLSLLVCFLSVFSQAQTPFNRSSASVTAIDARLRASLNFGVPIVADTTLNGGLDSLGSLVYSKAQRSLFVRDTNMAGAHKWTRVILFGQEKNLATASLDANGNYTHHWHGYQLIIDSLGPVGLGSVIPLTTPYTRYNAFGMGSTSAAFNSVVYDNNAGISKKSSILSLGLNNGIEGVFMNVFDSSGQQVNFKMTTQDTPRVEISRLLYLRDKLAVDIIPSGSTSDSVLVWNQTTKEVRKTQPLNTLTVQSEMSVTGNGSSANKLKLVNDQTSPGNDKYYSTSYSGTKGYFNPDVAWYNIYKAGADSTGATDVSTFITAAMAAGNRYIYLPKGKYLISSQVQMKDSVTIKGDGRQNTIILLTSNITAFKGGLANGGMSCQFIDFGFSGTKTSGADSTQSGIVTDSLQKVYITNVGGYNLGGWMVNIRSSGFGFDLRRQTKGGVIISNCFTDSCYGGVRFNISAEYNTVDNSTFVNGMYGIYVNGGNNRVNNNNSSFNTVNLFLGAGTNNGHGMATGNTLNHAGYANVYGVGCDQGFALTNNMIYGGTGAPNLGRIVLINSFLIHFDGGDIAVDSIILNNAIGAWFIGVRFKHDRIPNWSVIGAAPTVFNTGIAAIATFSGELGVSVENIQPYSATSGALYQGFGFGNPSAADQRLFGLIAGSNPSGLTVRFSAKQEAFSESAWTDGVSHPTYWKWSTVPSGSITLTERMRLSAAGRLGIGQSAPTALLDVNGTGKFADTLTAPKLFLTNLNNGAGTDSVLVKIATGEVRKIAQSALTANTIYTADGTATSRTVTVGTFLNFAGANVGFGTGGPDRKVDILDASNPQLRLSQTDGTNYTDFQTNSSGYLQVTASGGRVGIGVTPTAAFHVSGSVKLDLEFPQINAQGDLYYRNSGGTLTSLGIGGNGQVLTSNGTIPSWATPNFAASTYTPTLTNGTNVSASTAYACQYLRVGNVVTVSGRVDIDPTSSLTLTSLGISLPIASSFSGTNNVGGTASASEVADNAAAVRADIANSRAELRYVCEDTTNHAMYFTFTYVITLP